MPRKKKDTIKSSYLMDSELKAEIVRTGDEDERNETQQLHYLARLGLKYRQALIDQMGSVVLKGGGDDDVL